MYGPSILKLFFIFYFVGNIFYLSREHPSKSLVHHAGFFSLLFVMLSDLCSQRQ
jgi:hypothetical protein